MWQHASNIVLGLILIAIIFLKTGANILSSLLMSIFAAIGIVIVALALWGLLDELSDENEENPENLSML